MADYRYLFSKRLHEKLKSMVIGKVYCVVNPKDQLYVTIEQHEDMRFEIYIKDISERLMRGYSTDYAAYEIVEKYKRFITNRFIK